MFDEWIKLRLSFKKKFSYSNDDQKRDRSNVSYKKNFVNYDPAKLGDGAVLTGFINSFYQYNGD